MWEGSTDPAGGLIEQTIKREMERLFNEYRSYDQATLIAAFQALLIYSIILLFPSPQKPSPGTFNQVTLVSLQDVGSYVMETNLVLPAESIHARPCWEEWVLVNVKRRTLMSLYCFEWMYAKLNSLPSYPCTEIGFIPAPAGKILWGARTRNEWESGYDRWLGRWTVGGFYRLGELAEVQPGPEIDSRTERWLEEADEFGMMYMALVNATEGYLCLATSQRT
ncbi:hypothetical protein LSUE1_G001894 [Lachnellula suecica]|uniref:Uncharacterized protein n=1 Tax=Lachnellula suecica TaxID=602035 RepID=A0A8T9CBG8_9HELO|nr:hypothetical protein LSUE1_G001894 [Lachnellula suecica]